MLVFSILYLKSIQLPKWAKNFSANEGIYSSYNIINYERTTYKFLDSKASGFIN